MIELDSAIDEVKIYDSLRLIYFLFILIIVKPHVFHNKISGLE